MKKTDSAVCNLYDQRRNPAESAEYDTPTYHMRPAYYCSVGAAAYEMPVRQASIGSQIHPGSVSTFRLQSPGLYEEPDGNGAIKPGVPRAGDYEVAVRTQLELDNELYTTVDEASELMHSSLKYRPPIPPPVLIRQNSDLTNQEYSRIVRSIAERTSLRQPKKNTQEEINYFTLEKIPDEDDPTGSSFRIDQGSGTDGRGKGHGEEEDNKEQEEKDNDPSVKEEQLYSKLDRSESGQKVDTPVGNSHVYFSLEHSPDTNID